MAKGREKNPIMRWIIKQFGLDLGLFVKFVFACSILYFAVLQYSNTSLMLFCLIVVDIIYSIVIYRNFQAKVFK